MFRFCGGGVLWESFFVGLGGAGFSAGCGYRTLFVGGKYLRNAFNEPIGCEAALSKNTSRQTKNFPQEHPPKQSETNYRNAAAGALGESFFVAWGDTDFLQGAAIALFLWGTHFADMPCTSAGRRNLGTHVRHNL